MGQRKTKSEVREGEINVVWYIMGGLRVELAHQMNRGHKPNTYTHTFKPALSLPFTLSRSTI
ncbi:hypothetical protein J6590_014905, partial [Homalodisca vitripennis]